MEALEAKRAAFEALRKEGVSGLGRGGVQGMGEDSILLRARQGRAVPGRRKTGERKKSAA